MTGKRIRPAGPMDLLPLSASPRIALRLDLTQQLIFAHRPLRELLSSWLPTRERFSLLLFQGEEGLLACGQDGPCSGTSAWEERYLAAWQAAVSSVQDVWADLLLALGKEAGRHRALRLLAALPTETHSEPFHRAGFLAYSQEMILHWDGATLPDVGEQPALQLLGSEHLWAIQQLYQALTPPRVQQAEGHCSDSWQLQRGEEGWVWLQDEQILAHLRRRRGPRGTTLRLLLDPVYRHDAPGVLIQGLEEVRPPVYLVLRSYQGELLEVARRLGFQPYAQQVLLAKHLGIPAKQPQPLPARAKERHLETAPTTPSVGKV